MSTISVRKKGAKTWMLEKADLDELKAAGFTNRDVLDAYKADRLGELLALLAGEEEAKS